MKRSIQSKRVVLPEGVRAATIVYDDGVIVAHEAYQADSASIDCGDCYLLPGLVDTHVHINEPGRTHWEGFSTATRAAAAGGITCVVDMPLNSVPATTSIAALEQKRRSAREQCWVDYAFWGGLTSGNLPELALLAGAGVRGFKCFMAPSGVAEFEMVTETDLRLALPTLAATGLPLLVHAEWPDALVPAAGAAWHRYADYLASRPDTAETQAIDLLIRLLQDYQFPLHIVHLASAEPLPLLAAARAAGLPITVETCPHYLFFAAENIPTGATAYKCAPPIRGQDTQHALWNALKDGVIDLITTDHSPCPPAMKCLASGDFAAAWGGIASLSLALSAVYTAAIPRGFSITDIVRWMAEKPARLAGLETSKGSLAPGFDADFTVFDPDVTFRVAADQLHFRHPVTPYLGHSLQGQVQQTFVRGECVYRQGQFAGRPAGRECRV